MLEIKTVSQTKSSVERLTNRTEEEGRISELDKVEKLEQSNKDERKIIGRCQAWWCRLQFQHLRGRLFYIVANWGYRVSPCLKKQKQNEGTSGPKNVCDI